ncbi:nucleoside hydrolase [Cohnella pontilimi]|uniref:Nucleoside hydrolase n=1 Tax=Cohnella pontilimi TaxID=2564100 RepID=A0A4U0FBE8_9BACL|nr:nucleoside hydrolase [Cohnella pontilimi]TJY42156.1 nucleoside hydrolase [Cohnella pontilimi]
MSGLRQERVIIDTDIGGDPDDATAISLALASPEMMIEGITTVYSDVHYHARRVARLLELAGSRPIPIYHGLNQTLLRNRNVSWTSDSDTQDDSGMGDLLDQGSQPPNAGHAVDFIVRSVTNHPGEITLVCIGPLTNIAAAIIMEPRVIRQVKQLIVMGGVTRLGSNGAELYPVEHNIKCDPEAASVVFSSGAPIVMVGLDVTCKVTVSRRETQRLIDSGKPVNAALADVIERWLQRIGEDRTPMHDPLAMALAIDRTLVTTRRMKVQVVYDHREGTGQTVAVADPHGTVEVALDVDADRFLDLLFNRLCDGGK